MTEIDFKTVSNSIFYLPCCIFFKDTDLKYRFCTKYWVELNGEDYYGKTDLEIRLDTENAKLAQEKDLEILKTRKGVKYTIQSEVTTNPRFLEIIKEPVIDKNDNVVGIVGLINDITEKILLYKDVQRASTFDDLTCAYNRRAGIERIEKLLLNDESKIFCLLDIDHFKSYNDTYGHHIGDKILQEVSKAINDSTSGRDIISRIGGDEFIILLRNRYYLDFVNKLFDNIEKINVCEKQPTISIGLIKVKDDKDFYSLYTKADANMYEAKKNNDINSYLFTSANFSDNNYLTK